VKAESDHYRGTTVTARFSTLACYQKYLRKLLPAGGSSPGGKLSWR
jgi:hypothetical protein